MVTGAAGFVGSALAHGFADLGWSVLGLDRRFEGDPEKASTQYVACDLLDGLPAGLPDVDLVVHAAWITTGPETLGISTDEYSSLNLRPFSTVLEHVARSATTDLVFLSSSGVFAPDDAVHGLSDRDRPTGQTPYAAAKRAAEVLALTGSAEPTRVHVVRLGYLYGMGEVASPSREGVSPIAGWLDAARRRAPLQVRTDDPRRDWTFTADLAPALARLTREPPAGHAIHLGSRHVHRDTEVVSLIASHFPGVRTVASPSPHAQKPPMVSSELEALGDFEWTDLATGIGRLVHAGAVA